MALSGSFSQYCAGTKYRLRIEWSATQDVSTNTSTIKTDMYLDVNAALEIGSRTNTITIDGQTFNIPSSAITSKGTKHIGGCSKTVTHKADGTRQVAMAAMFDFKATISGTYYSKINASTTVTLNTIPRASTINDYSGKMGVAGNIIIKRAASSFTDTITYKFGSANGAIATKTSDTTISWTPPKNLAEQIVKSQRGTGIITCQTYNGNTLIGSNSATLTLSVAEDAKPTCSGIDFTKINNTVPADWDIFIQYKSGVKATIADPTTKYNATISTYKFSTDTGFNATTNPWELEQLYSSGTINFSTQITDSRGLSSNTVTDSIYVHPYRSPTLNSSTIERCLEDGTLDDEGTYLSVLIDGEISPCDDKNTLSIVVNVKKTLTREYEYSYVVPNGVLTVIGEGKIDPNYTYDLEILLTDAFETASYSKHVNTSYSTLEFLNGGRGISFGKAASIADTFECDMKAQFNKQVSFKKQIGSDLYVLGEVTANNSIKSNDYMFSYNGMETDGIFRTNAHGVASTFGPLSREYCNYETEAERHYFNKSISINGDVTADSLKINVNGVLCGTGGGTVKKREDTLLWGGSWASGTITATGIADYTYFKIIMEGQGTTVFAIKKDSYIRGIGGYSNASATPYVYFFASTFSGNKVTMVSCENVNLSSMAHTKCTVTHIYGVI